MLTAVSKMGHSGVTFPVLTPNIKVKFTDGLKIEIYRLSSKKGYRAAVDCGATEVAIFGAASEAFRWESEELLSRITKTLNAFPISAKKTSIAR